MPVERWGSGLDGGRGDGWLLRTIEYDLWASGRVLAAAEPLLGGPAGSSAGASEAGPAERDTLSAILSHLVATREVWLGRITGEPAPTPVFPGPRPIGETRERLAEVVRAWRDALGASPEIGPEIRYTSSESERWASTLGDIVEHTHLHGCYHRGQCAMLIRSLGGEPPATDFIVFTRRRPADGRARPGM